MPRSRTTLDKTAALHGIIHEIRGERVILDADLAKVYGVGTKVLNQAVKRNRSKFPDDFLLQLTPREHATLMRSQTVTASSRTSAAMRSQSVTASKRNLRHRPFAFTEHGAIHGGQYSEQRLRRADERVRGAGVHQDACDVC